MGLDLNSFAAGFFGKAVKDREAASEEERLAKRQALIIKLQEESQDRQNLKKTSKGKAWKDGDTYMVQDTDGDGNNKGPPRPAQPDEIREYEASDADLAGKKARTAVDVKQASNYDEDRQLGIDERKQRMSLDREQNARGWASEKRMSAQDKDAKAASKASASEEKKATATASQALAVLDTIPRDKTWTPKNTAAKKLYDEINLTTALGRAGQLPNWHNKLNRLLIQARALSGVKDEAEEVQPMLDITTKK